MKEKIILFFKETASRWSQRSPKAMRIYRTINLGIGFVGGLGFTLTQLQVIFSGETAKLIFAIIGFCGSYAAANNNLVTSKAVNLPLTEKLKAEELAKTVFYESLAKFPEKGFNDFIYFSQATQKKYKWNGESYQEL